MTYGSNTASWKEGNSLVGGWFVLILWYAPALVCVITLNDNSSSLTGWQHTHRGSRRYMDIVSGDNEAFHITMFRVWTWQERHGRLSVWQRLINLPINHCVLCWAEGEKKLRTKCVSVHQVQSRTLWVTRQVASKNSVQGKKFVLELSVQVNRWCNQCEQGAPKKHWRNLNADGWLYSTDLKTNQLQLIFPRFFCLHKPKSFWFPAWNRCRSQTVRPFLQHDLFVPSLLNLKWNLNWSLRQFMSHISEGGV